MMTPGFLSATVLRIKPISFLNLFYITILRYFGIITIWYLQLYVVCDSVLSSLIEIPPLIFILWLPATFIISLEVFFSPTLKAFLDHTHSVWFSFIINKTKDKPSFYYKKYHLISTSSYSLEPKPNATAASIV